MANDRILKPRKGSGWSEVAGEPTAPAPTTETPERFGESSTPSPPTGASISVSRQELVTIHDAVLGGPKWREVHEGLVALSEDEKQRLLEEVLGDAPTNLENVRALYDALRTKDSLAGCGKKLRRSWFLPFG